MHILLVDDEKTIRVTLSDDLRDAGHTVVAADSGDKALDLLQDNPFDLLISDIRMPGTDGMALMRVVRERWPETDVIMITGHGSIETAVEAMKLGALDYIRKPFLNDEVVVQLAKIAEFRNAKKSVARLSKENVNLREALSSREAFAKIIGDSPPMMEVLGRIDTVAKTDATVLITGESGTGKELIAGAIHRASPRRDRPLVVLSCATLPETLLEDELFGHEKGAFTDAREAKPGRFERAQGGTIFIDDIDDMSLTTQVKLLRVLQERSFERLGGVRAIDLDIRVIAATKIDLGIAVEEGKFREDLYYRLNVVPLELPPLRERREDVPLLARFFIGLHGGGRDYDIQPEVLKALMQYPWPGNVRQLENAVQRAIALAGDNATLKKDDLIQERASQVIQRDKRYGTVRLAEAVRQTEKEQIQRVLEEVGGQRGQAAEILGISRKTLWEKMRLYGLS